MKGLVVCVSLLLCGFSQVSAADNGEQKVLPPPFYYKSLVHSNLSNDSVLSVFEARFRQLDSLLSDRLYSQTLPGYCAYVPDLNLDSLFRYKTDEEIKAFKRKSGLELTGQAYYRPDSSFGFDDEDSYSRYIAKFQGEVGWNIFNSSVLQRKSEIRRIELSNDLQKIQMQSRLGLDNHLFTEEEVKDGYNRQIAVALYNRLVNTDILNMAYQYALEQDKISNEKLLKVMDDKMDLQYALLQICSVDSVADEPLLLPLATVASVDTTLLFAGIPANNPEMQAGYIKSELLDTEAKLCNYAQQMRFTPFVRGSNYLRDGGMKTSTNVDVGVRFTFPLYDDSPAKRRALRAESELARSDRYIIGDKIRERCLLLLDRLGKLNETIVAEDRHLTRMYGFLEIRHTAYAQSEKGYNYIARMEEYNSYLKSVERLYRLMLARDLCLLEIRDAAGYDVPVTVEALKRQ